MRVLITSTPGTGHVHPLVPVADAMRSAGHDVRWAVAQDALPQIERRGYDVFSAGMPVRERLGAFTEQFGPQIAQLPPDQRRPFAFAGHFAHLAAPKMRTDLDGVFARWRPDVVVHETAELAGPAFAEAAGIPHATVAFSGELSDVVLRTAADAVSPVWNDLGLDVPGDLGLYRHAYFHPFPSAMGQRPGAVTVRELRPVGEDGAGDDAPPEWIAPLGTARPLVYLTFGTEMAPVAPWQTVVPALGALGDVDVVVTIGGALDPAALGALPDGVRVERYVPQSWLLGRCSLVVSHAGAGTLLAAAAHGVPQLLLPIGADQFENTDAIIAAGAGRSGAGCTTDELVDAARSLLDDASWHAAAVSLADGIRAMPGPDRAADAISELVVANG